MHQRIIFFSLKYMLFFVNHLPFAIRLTKIQSNVWCQVKLNIFTKYILTSPPFSKKGSTQSRALHIFFISRFTVLKSKCVNHDPVVAFQLCWLNSDGAVCMCHLFAMTLFRQQFQEIKICTRELQKCFVGQDIVISSL